jgi:hypothetical protein
MDLWVSVNLAVNAWSVSPSLVTVYRASARRPGKQLPEFQAMAPARKIPEPTSTLLYGIVRDPPVAEAAGAI